MDVGGEGRVGRPKDKLDAGFHGPITIPLSLALQEDAYVLLGPIRAKTLSTGKLP